MTFFGRNFILASLSRRHHFCPRIIQSCDNIHTFLTINSCGNETTLFDYVDWKSLERLFLSEQIDYQFAKRYTVQIACTVYRDESTTKFNVLKKE